ncbi:MAG: hypothetical protein A2654_00525 [Candidatus Nealsonbacteria bacterium RIFCSPHIGHO2_01_FULL_43_31]|uniref:Orotate phosphoribosyltransferase n=2 Tax=Candidatus Nealsoniibacteriota TaxID=1817911 RepID=A0A1G2E957_9BACT|nr:MAG: hypothetical protein A2654_00525 [Candidatus Nealsonbacteria bacterium RIFCSPHIGHO2_01_FULL_43_31]OGZ22132.1 MAG: hypothetical protein A3D46_02280 [Candidatus Nealsonbacteria bacterium RIFCSPHIGHO2_02_FULL_43_13]OGZ25542.1 MAG: hypothetical protein A2922_00905 [Candidatus Nealsonbacteria bacterium RIFCSPLOWO2_01_FULL_43_36]
MNQEERIELFRQTTAFLSGHFLLHSGLHADKYVAKRRLYSSPRKVKELCLEITKHFRDLEVQAVASPAVGGVALSQWVGIHFADLLGREVPAVFVEKDEDNPREFKFSEGCGDFIVGKKTLLVDDVLTTGGSIEAARRAIIKAGGTVIAVAVLWQRCEKIELDVPFYALIHKVFPSWAPPECPLCAKNIPLIKPH